MNFAGEYVASGSDDGRWFIWEKKTGRLIKVLVGDGAGKYHCIILIMNFYHLTETETEIVQKLFTLTFSVVNCVQSHPFDCAIATSGIDNTIKVLIFKM